MIAAPSGVGNYAVFPSLRKLTGRVRVVPSGMADASIGKKYERFDQRRTVARRSSAGSDQARKGRLVDA